MTIICLLVNQTNNHALNFSNIPVTNSITLFGYFRSNNFSTNKNKQKYQIIDPIQNDKNK
jgi:hypothetical protein